MTMGLAGEATTTPRHLDGCFFFLRHSDDAGGGIPYYKTGFPFVLEAG